MKIVEAAEVTPPPPQQEPQLPDIGLLEYLKGYIEKNRNAQQIHTVRSFGTLRNRLEQYSGEVSLRSVTADYIEGFREHLKAEGLAEASQSLYIDRLNTVLRSCMVG
jgi:hypothetical protein